MAKFDPYRKWLGIPPKEQPPNHYRLLGIGPFESDPDVISNAADRQMVHVRTFQSGKYCELSQRILNELAAARVCLLDAQRRSEYDRQLRASLAAEMPTPPPRTPTPPPRTPTPPPRTPAPPPPPDGESGPTAAPPPQVAAGGTAFPSPTRPSSYAARRKKSNWQGPAITIALLLVSVVLVVWASSTSKSEHGNKQDSTKVKRNENGSSNGRSVKRPRKPRDAGGSGNGRHGPARPRPPVRDDDPPRGIPGLNGHTDGDSGAASSPDFPLMPGLTDRNEDGPQGKTPGGPARESGRIAAPDADSQRKAEKLIKNEVFKTDFQQADRPSRKSALAQKLLDEGVKPQDNPASAYVLLQLARNLATELADADTALAAVDQIAKRYRIHALSEKVKTLDTVAQQTKASTRKRALVETILEVADEARAADDFNTAEQLVVLARATVAGARDGTLSKRVTAKAEQIQELKRAYDGVRQALAVLEQQPDDPQANETVGKYYCLAKGDWERGLSRLAAAADEELKKLAQTDLAHPQPTPQRHELAEGWWDAAQKHSGQAKKQLQRRAAKWYKLVEPQLVGIERTAVQQRLLEAGDPDALIAPHTLPQLKGLECRKDTIRPTLLRAFGGNAASEEAVDRALEWLSRHQNTDGSWNFDHTGPRCQDRCPNPGKLKTAPNAATALALLPFLGAGHGPRSGKYKKNVTLGLNYLRSRTVWLGPVATLYESDAADMPSHALGTIALSEACAVGRDRPTWAVAQAAVKFIAISQNADGGWGTKPQLPDQQPGPSDVYSTGWNLAALKTAQWAGLNVPKKTLQQAQKYLQSMRTKDKTGYRRDESAGKRDAAATAVAMLCRMYLDMPRDQQELVDYVAALGKSGPATKGEYYLNYYKCQVIRQYGGPAWDSWNAVLRDHLIFTQAGKDHAAGSWYIQDKSFGNKSGGRLFCTALAALMLEVYYRHPPLYQ